jgi:hypothetical protein
LLNNVEKSRIYNLIEEHDTPFALYRQFVKMNQVPGFKSLKRLNDRIDSREGVGLLYLLIFKLADIDGHKTIEDVTWFFKATKENYFDRIGVVLPIPMESDVR